MSCSSLSKLKQKYNFNMARGSQINNSGNIFETPMNGSMC